MSTSYKSIASCLSLLGLLMSCGCGVTSTIGHLATTPSSPSATTSASTATLLISGIALLDLVGETAQLHLDEVVAGAAPVDATNGASWQVSPAGTLVVSNSGLVTCIATGTAQITASKDNASSHISFTCENDVATLTLSRSAISARIGVTTLIRASATSKAGTTLDVTAYIAWISKVPIINVGSSGAAKCSQPGSTIITAVYGTQSQAVPVSCSLFSWTSPTYFREQSDEFVGPFPSWVNVKTAYGAVGDGRTDDTVAIQKAFDQINASGNNSVLWFPAGTYLITAPVTLTHKQYFSVIGEDPATTILKWAGPSGGTMLQTNASTFFRITRFTFDGNNSADTAETITTLDNSPGGYYATFNELSDQHIKGVNAGIRLSVDAETTVDRIFFDGLSSYGLQTGNFNTLNIFINDSLFVDCGTGVSNWYGAGSFIVSNSFFSRSRVADMSIGNTSYFTARHNTSVGSATFFLAGAMGANPAQITLQNNTILDPTNIPVQLGDQGPLMLIDNVIRMQHPDLPAVQGVDDTTVSHSLFTFGNTFSTNISPNTQLGNPFQGPVSSYDDTVVDPSSIPDASVPTNVYVPANLHRTIFEIAPNASGTSIQNAIALAVASGSKGSVIHFPTGNYHLTNTLRVPSGSDLQLIGDDSHSTVLLWDGTGIGPALDIEADLVSVRSLRLNSGSGQLVDGIRMSVADQPTTQIVVDQAQLQGGNSYSVNFDGLEHANAELFSTYTMGSVTGVNIVGGPYRAAKAGAIGATNFYSGSLQSVANATSFNVTNGGKFMVQDNWHDGGETSPRNFILSGSGTVTEQSGAVYMNSDKPFEIDDFDGKVSLIGLMFEGGFSTNPGRGTTQLLTLGLDGVSVNYQPQSAGNLTAHNMLNEYYLGGGHQIASQDAVDVQWLRQMLAQTRAEYPSPRRPLSTSGSRLRLARVEIYDFASALHIIPKTVPDQLFYTLSTSEQLFTTGAAGGQQCSVAGLAVPTNVSSWRLIDAGDGDFILADSSGTNALGTINDQGVLAMAPLNSQYQQRWMLQDVGDGRRTFSNRGTNGLLSWSPGSCPQLSNSGSDSSKWTLVAN